MGASGHRFGSAWGIGGWRVGFLGLLVQPAWTEPPVPYDGSTSSCTAPLKVVEPSSISAALVEQRPAPRPAGGD